MPILQYPSDPLWPDMTAEQRAELAQRLAPVYQRLLARAAALSPAPDPEPAGELEEAPRVSPL